VIRAFLSAASGRRYPPETARCPCHSRGE
jgi:hypothetical protein